MGDRGREKRVAERPDRDGVHDRDRPVPEHRAAGIGGVHDGGRAEHEVRQVGREERLPVHGSDGQGPGIFLPGDAGGAGLGGAVRRVQQQAGNLPSEADERDSADD
ncbi:52kD-s105aa [Fowl aviadenovirus 4]|nr:52kD-s105aa [Fowl aviadenovirus 4]